MPRWLKVESCSSRANLQHMSCCKQNEGMQHVCSQENRKMKKYTLLRSKVALSLSQLHLKTKSISTPLPPVAGCHSATEGVCRTKPSRRIFLFQKQSIELIDLDKSPELNCYTDDRHLRILGEKSRKRLLGVEVRDANFKLRLRCCILHQWLASQSYAINPSNPRRLFDFSNCAKRFRSVEEENFETH